MLTDKGMEEVDGNPGSPRDRIRSEGDFQEVGGGRTLGDVAVAWVTFTGAGRGAASGPLGEAVLERPESWLHLVAAFVRAVTVFSVTTLDCWRSVP